jgi:hypothetical protein
LQRSESRILPPSWPSVRMEQLCSPCTLCDSAWISSVVSSRRPFSFSFIFGNREKSHSAKSGEYGGCGMPATSYFAAKVLGEDGNVSRGVFMVKQPGLFSPKFWATSWHVFTQSPQNIAVQPGIHSLACWERCFALPQLLYRCRHQSGIFWIPHRTDCCAVHSQPATRCPRFMDQGMLLTTTPHVLVLAIMKTEIYVMVLK